MKAARDAWFETQPELDPERLVFIDETGLNTKMARLRGGSGDAAGAANGSAWPCRTGTGGPRLSSPV